MEGSRPTLNDTFMELATVWSHRATCPRSKAGCVIVSPEGYVISSGYNGAPRGLPHCTQLGCLIEHNHCVRALHAEANAILTAAREGVTLNHGTIYCTLRPCVRCVNMLIQTGIRCIIYRDDYNSDDIERVIALCADAGVSLWRDE